MNTRDLSCLFGSCVLSISPLPILASEFKKGPYLTGGIGVNYTGIPTVEYSQTSTGDDVTEPTLSKLTGSAVTGSSVSGEVGFGYDFGRNYRAELTYIRNNVGIQSFTGSVTEINESISFSYTPSSGLSTNSVFVSVYYDLPSRSTITPYFGVGLGYTSVSISQLITIGSESESINTLGYLGKIGLSYSASKMSDLYLEGVYQGNTGSTTDYSQIKNSSNSGFSSASKSATYSPLNSVSVRAGIRLRFGK